MAKVRIPSLQHFTTFFGGDTNDVYRRMVEREDDIINVSYTDLRDKWLFDLIQLGMPFDDVRSVVSKIKGARNRKANLEALDALKDYIELVRGLNCVRFTKTYYPIGRGLQVPVNPPMLLVSTEQKKVLWISFWATRKLTGLRASLFATILEDAIFTLPDLRDFELDLIDLSRPYSGQERSATLFARDSFPRLAPEALRGELDKFVEAWFRRARELAGVPVNRTENREDGVGDLPLFLDR